MKRVKKKFIVIISIILVFIAVFLFLRPSSVIEFNDISRKVEINSIIDYYQYIEEVHNGSKEDVVIDDSQVKLNTLGKYKIIYSVGDKSAELEIEIVDTVAPEVSLKSKTIIYDYDLSAEELITEIKDSTQTKAYFKKNYRFNKSGDQEVVVVVEDEGKNKTEATTTVKVLEEDKEEPTIKTDELELYLDSQTNLDEKLEISDNQDQNVKIEINEEQLDRTKEGTYNIEVTATDASGNINKKEVKVHVKKRKVSKDKVVYLTFDDGPSRYTPQVLEILEKYNVKATFFVTGMNKDYYSYMKEAVNQGHAIGLHTYTHSYNKIYASIEAYFEDLEKIQKLVEEQTGMKSTLIRFPGGSSNTVSKKYCKGIMSQLVKMVEEKGYRYFDWNCENGDGYSQMAKRTMIKRATSSKANQVMILMHDANGKKATVETLPEIIEYYLNKGYQFKVIDDSTPDFHQSVNN